MTFFFHSINTVGEENKLITLLWLLLSVVALCTTNLSSYSIVLTRSFSWQQQIHPFSSLNMMVYFIIVELLKTRISDLQFNADYEYFRFQGNVCHDSHPQQIFAHADRIKHYCHSLLTSRVSFQCPAGTFHLSTVSTFRHFTCATGEAI